MRALWVCLVLLCGVAVAGEPGGAAVAPESVEAVAARVGKSVIVLADMAGDYRSGQGSGFFVAPGVVVTNHHVIADVSGEMVALLPDGKKHPVLGLLADDPAHDLALLRIDTEGPPPLVLAPVATIHVTEPVMAVGSPQGLDQTFSTGIISALRDTLPDDIMGEDKTTVGPFVQTTAAGAPGSSGGPLVDAEGRVVAVTHSGIEGAGIELGERVDALATLIAHTDLSAKPKPIGADVRRNLVISAAFLGAIVLAGVIASFVSRRRNRPRAKMIIRA